MVVSFHPLIFNGLGGGGYKTTISSSKSRLRNAKVPGRAGLLKGGQTTRQMPCAISWVHVYCTLVSGMSLASLSHWGLVNAYCRWFLLEETVRCGPAKVPCPPRLFLSRKNWECTWSRDTRMPGRVLGPRPLLLPGLGGRRARLGQEGQVSGRRGLLSDRLKKVTWCLPEGRAPWCIWVHKEPGFCSGCVWLCRCNVA